MNTDEAEIRALVATWLQATRSGDVDTVLGLMSDDVVFLVPGQAPMDKAAFAAAAKSQSGSQAQQFDAASEIQEIRVLGDWAYMWTRLAVGVRFADGRPGLKRAGHTLSILRRESGRWRLLRDANMLAPVAPQGAGHT